MKSRFFSTNEVFVDVSEIVGIRIASHMQWVVFRNGTEMSVTTIDAKAIQQAVLDYEAAMQEQWDSPWTRLAVPAPATEQTGAKVG